MPLGPQSTPEEQEVFERWAREGKIVAHPPGWTPPPLTFEPLPREDASRVAALPWPIRLLYTWHRARLAFSGLLKR